MTQWVAGGGGGSPDPIAEPVAARFQDDTGGWTAGSNYADVDVWNTTPDWEAGGTGEYSVDANGLFTLPEAGNYLVIYNLVMAYDSTETAWECRIKFASSNLPGSHASGYAAVDVDKVSILGHGLIVAPGANTFSIQCKRGTDNSQLGSVSGESYVQIVRLPDSADTAFAHYSGTGDDGAGQTWIDQTWTSVEVETDTDVIELQGDNVSVKVKEAGHYLVGYGYYTKHTGGSTKTQRISRCLVEGVEPAGTRSHAYMKDAQNQWNSLSNLFLIEAAANDDLTFQIQRGDATSDATVTPQGIGAWVMKVPAARSLVICSDSVAEQDLSVAADTDLNLMRDEDSNEGSLYTVDNNTDISVNSSHVALILGNAFAERDNTLSSLYGTMVLGAEIDGVDSDVGMGGGLIRGNVGANDCFNGCPRVHLIADLSASDVIQIEARDAGDAGDSDDNSQPDLVGVSILQL